MSECLFCKIASGEKPSERIYQDDLVLGILNDNPINPGHALVIPKRHFATLFDLPPEELHACIMASQKISRAICRATRAPGLNLIQNNNEAAGQSVAHVHFHLIPRHEADGFVTSWSGESCPPERAKEIAGRIRAEMNA